MQASYEKTGSTFYPHQSLTSDPNSHLFQFHHPSGSTNQVNNPGFVMNPSYSSIRRNENGPFIHKTDQLQTTAIQSRTYPASVTPQEIKTSYAYEERVPQVESMVVRKDYVPAAETYVQNSQVRRNQMLEEIDRPRYEKLYSMPQWENRELSSRHERAKRKTCCAPPCWILWALLGLVAVVLGMLFGLGLLGGANADKDTFGGMVTGETSGNGIANDTDEKDGEESQQEKDSGKDSSSINIPGGEIENEEEDAQKLYGGNNENIDEGNATEQEENSSTEPSEQGKQNGGDKETNEEGKTSVQTQQSSEKEENSENGGKDANNEQSGSGNQISQEEGNTGGSTQKGDEDKSGQGNDASSETQEATSYMYPVNPHAVDPLPVSSVVVENSTPAEFQNWKTISIQPEAGVAPIAVPTQQEAKISETSQTFPTTEASG